MDEEFLTCVHSEDSHRQAMLVDDGVTGILYLHAPSDDIARPGPVEATCFAYNRVDPIDPKDIPSYRPNPPPIARGYASKDAVCRKPKSHQWTLDFSTNGKAVLLLRDGKPWAIAALDAPTGFSKAIDAPGPWGSPWSIEVHKATEWGGRGTECT